ncbi:MAG: dihydrofolate reductase family protein [Actinomycetes bacterium]
MTLDLRNAELPEIANHYQSPNSSWVRANMVVSKDGQFVGPNNTSRDLTSAQDLSLLLLLRALSDVLLVGANTARQENYRAPKKRAEFAFLNRPTTTLAIVSSSLDFDLASPLFHGGEQQTLILNAGGNEPSNELLKVAKVVQVLSDSNFGIRLIETLSDLGFPKVTCEGGPGLLSQLLAAEVVDEYDLTISPIVSGIRSPLPNVLPNDLNWHLAASASAGDFKFQRYLRNRA